MSSLSEKDHTQVLQRALFGESFLIQGVFFGSEGWGKLVLLDLLMMESTASSNFIKNTRPQTFL